MSKSEAIPAADRLAAFEKAPHYARTSLPTVCALYDIGPATVWRRVKAGLIPAPLKEGGCTRWLVGDLREALEKAQ